jgi:hypothetical protein
MVTNIGNDAVVGFDGEFNSYKATFFDTNRKGFFHYAIFCHRYDNSANNSSGRAELNGDDFVVSLQCILNDSAVSKTMMHELGHNLNLRHGGFEDLNQKPNYNSIMNYRYQFWGTDSNCDAIGNGSLDYSQGTLATIDENNLNECLGICGAGFPIDWNMSGGACETNVALNITTGQGGSSSLDILADYDDWANIVLDNLVAGDRVVVEQITCQDVPSNP